MKNKKFILINIFTVLLLNNSINTQAEVNQKSFKNCTELNKTYPGGVAVPGAKNKGGQTKKKPIFDKNLYDLNKKSDRDKDGIACEK